MMTFGYSFNIWVPLLAFPTAGTYGAPRWQHGWPISFVFWFLLFVGFIAATVMGKRGYVPKSLSLSVVPTNVLLTSHRELELGSTMVRGGAEDASSEEAVSVEVHANEKAG